jgi:hypothetical protein
MLAVNITLMTGNAEHNVDRHKEYIELYCQILLIARSLAAEPNLCANYCKNAGESGATSMDSSSQACRGGQRTAA